MSSNAHQTLMTNEITEKMLLERKVLFLLPDDDGNFDNKYLLDIFKKSFKLGITWIVKQNDGVILFRKTNE